MSALGQSNEDLVKLCCGYARDCSLVALNISVDSWEDVDSSTDKISILEKLTINFITNLEKFINDNS